MRINIILLTFIFLCVYSLFSKESSIITSSDDDEIRILQKTRTKFIFYKDNTQIFTSEAMKSLLKDIPDALHIYNKSHSNFIGFSVMMGLGIGFSIANAIGFVTSLAVTIRSSQISMWAGISATSVIGVLLISAVILWISGTYNRAMARVGEARAVQIYNKIKKENKIKLNFIPDIYFDEKFNPGVLLNVSLKLS